MTFQVEPHEFVGTSSDSGITVCKLCKLPERAEEHNPLNWKVSKQDLYGMLEQAQRHVVQLHTLLKNMSTPVVSHRILDIQQDGWPCLFCGAGGNPDTKEPQHTVDCAHVEAIAAVALLEPIVAPLRTADEEQAGTE